MQHYFKKFGEVENVQITRKVAYAYGFVQYSTALSAAKALKTFKHRIGRNYVKVVAANSWHQPSPFIEMDESTGTNSARMLTRQGAAAAAAAANRTSLTDLNEDCLLEVFGQLTVIDLSAIEQTCLRFQAIAQNIFSKRHRIFDFDEKDKIGDGVRIPYTLHTIRNIIVSFGALITELNISAYVSDPINRERIANMLERHCHNLETLRLHDFYFTRKCQPIFGKLFGRLTSLTLGECDLEEKCSVLKLMERCENLTSLKLESCGKLGNRCIDIAYPKLEEFSIESLYTDDETLYAFFERNGKLKRLKISQGGYLGNDVFAQIAMHLKQLESLSIVLNGFDDFVHSLTNLLTLNHLKELKLNCSLYSISGFVNRLAEKNTIELLHITDGVLNEQLIDALCKCKRLTSVKLGSMPNVHDRFLLELAKNLPQLTEFHLSKCQTTTQKGLVNLVRHSPNLERLYLNKTIIDFTDEVFMELVELRKKRGPLQIFCVQSKGYVRNDHGLTKELTAKHTNAVKFVRVNENKYDDVEDDDDSLDDYSDYNDSDEDVFWGNFGSDDDLLFNNYEFPGEYYDLGNVNFFYL